MLPRRAKSMISDSAANTDTDGRSLPQEPHDPEPLDLLQRPSGERSQLVEFQI